MPLTFVGLDRDAREPRQLARFSSTKSGRNRIHLDLTSASRGPHTELVDRAISWGCRTSLVLPTGAR